MPTITEDASVPYLPSIGRLLGFASRAATMVSEKRLAEHGLTLQQWIALTALWRDDGMSVGQLAAYCRTTEPTTSSLMDRMEAKGLVERRRSKDDRRKVIVALTAKSRALAGLLGFYEEINELLLQGLSDDEQASLINGLERVIANAETAIRASDAI